MLDKKTGDIMAVRPVIQCLWCGEVVPADLNELSPETVKALWEEAEG